METLRLPASSKANRIQKSHGTQTSRWALFSLSTIGIGISDTSMPKTDLQEVVDFKERLQYKTITSSYAHALSCVLPYNPRSRKIYLSGA